MNYLILEEPSDHNFVAIPEEVYDTGIEGYRKCGSLQGISPKDFRGNGNLKHSYIPLEISGNLSEKVTKETGGLETILNRSSMETDRIAGDIYLVRFNGMDMRKGKDFQRSIAYLADGEISVDGHNVFYNGQRIQLPDCDVRFALDYDGIQGRIDAFKAGYAELNLQTFNPFTHDVYGNTHSPGLRIIQRHDLNKKIKFLHAQGE